MTSPLYRHLGATLRDAKGDRTTASVADKVGVAPQTVTSWLSGDRRISVEALIDVSRAIGRDPAELLAEACKRRDGQ